MNLNTIGGQAPSEGRCAGTRLVPYTKGTLLKADMIERKVGGLCAVRISMDMSLILDSPETGLLVGHRTQYQLKSIECRLGTLMASVGKPTSKTAFEYA